MPGPIRDPYVVLGVGPGTSDEQLHAAYRRLVRLHHPDHNPGDPDAARRFEEIQDAYARIRQLRAKRPAEARPPPSAESDPDVKARLAELERKLRKARARRERARRATAETAAQSTKRPSDEELGYVTTGDSFAKIVADASSELSSWLDRAQDQPARRRVADLLDELAAKVRGDRDRGSSQ
jgi:curved DNA-binding protein CbpA